MTELEGRAKLARGVAITLNEKAMAWTRGLVFEVEDVRGWGVVCFTEQQPPPGVHSLVDSGRAMYRAAWVEIASLTNPLAASDLTGNYPD